MDRSWPLLEVVNDPWLAPRLLPDQGLHHVRSDPRYCHRSHAECKSSDRYYQVHGALLGQLMDVGDVMPVPLGPRAESLARRAREGARLMARGCQTGIEPP